MNPLVALALTILALTVILVIVCEICLVAAAVDIVTTEGATSAAAMEREEIKEELKKRRVGRFYLALKPLAYWWLFPMVLWKFVHRKKETKQS